MRRLVGAVLVSLLVLACLPPPRAAAPATSPPSATPSLPPGASFLALEEAAAAYSAIAEPYNAEVDRIDREYDPRASLKDHQRYWALIAKADAIYLDGVRKIAFPPDIQDAATVLIKADTAFQQRAVAASKASSPAEAISLSAAANDAADAAAQKAALLRKALGLDPN